MSTTLKRTPRRPALWWWLGAYVIVVVIFMSAVLLLLRQDQPPVIALGVPSTVSAIALAVLTRLGSLAGLPAAAPALAATSAGAVRRPRV